MTTSFDDDPAAVPSAADLDRLRALTTAATPGPWQSISGSAYLQCSECDQGEYVAKAIASVYGPQHHHGEADAEFIAAARTWLPRLVDAVASLTEQVTSDAFAARLIAPEAHGIPHCKSYHPGPDPKANPLGWTSLCGRRGDRSIRPEWSQVTCINCLRIEVARVSAAEAALTETWAAFNDTATALSPRQHAALANVRAALDSKETNH